MKEQSDEAASRCGRCGAYGLKRRPSAPGMSRGFIEKNGKVRPGVEVKRKKRRARTQKRMYGPREMRKLLCVPLEK
jgi:hypothetical protein